MNQTVLVVFATIGISVVTGVAVVGFAYLAVTTHEALVKRWRARQERSGS